MAIEGYHPGHVHEAHTHEHTHADGTTHTHAHEHGHDAHMADAHHGHSTHWIAGAIKRPGSFSKAAKNAGMSTHAFAEKEKHSQHASTAMKRKANLALTLGKLRP